MSNHHESNLPSLRGIGPSRGTRRAWLQQAASGFGWLAAASLLNQATRLGKADDADGLPAPHHPATAKQVIFCYMSGGVSQVDSFDPKPALKQLHGQPIPFAAARTQFNNNGTMMASPWGFRPYGESGIEVIAFDMPIGTMHLQGMLRFADHNLVLAWPVRLAYHAVETLKTAGYRVEFLPDVAESIHNAAFNFVTLGPRKILMAAGNPLTQRFYESLDIECVTVEGDELFKAAGSIGCLSGIMQREMV